MIERIEGLETEQNNQPHKKASAEENRCHVVTANRPNDWYAHLSHEVHPRFQLHPPEDGRRQCIPKSEQDNEQHASTLLLGLKFRRTVATEYLEHSLPQLLILSTVCVLNM